MKKSTALLCLVAFAVTAARAVPPIELVHSFGKSLATGLCKLPSQQPIVSFPDWSPLTPDQPPHAVAVVAADGQLRKFEGLTGACYTAVLYRPARGCAVLHAVDLGSWGIHRVVLYTRCC